jgi:hypothetical protein
VTLFIERGRGSGQRLHITLIIKLKKKFKQKKRVERFGAFIAASSEKIALILFFFFFSPFSFSTMCFRLKLHFLYISILEFKEKKRKYFVSHILTVKKIIFGVNEFVL